MFAFLAKGIQASERIFWNMSYKNEFIKAYLDFLKYEVHNPIKVNLNKLNSILIHNYGENIIKSGTRHWLTKITLKEKINMALKDFKATLNIENIIIKSTDKDYEIENIELSKDSD